MGDRVSISFKDNEENSVCLFHHWGGTKFPKYAFDWFKLFQKEVKKQKSKGSDPTSRFEPRTMMSQFVSHIGQSPFFKECMGFEETNGQSDYNKPIYSKTELSHSIYFGKNENDGDNSDNGHYTIDVSKCKMFNQNNESIN
tara:strand:+ start:191 stop:613 length:423 start_codon:yes stop_codon:yes gene_type:complete